MVKVDHQLVLNDQIKSVNKMSSLLYPKSVFNLSQQNSPAILMYFCNPGVCYIPYVTYGMLYVDVGDRCLRRNFKARAICFNFKIPDDRAPRESPACLNCHYHNVDKLQSKAVNQSQFIGIYSTDICNIFEFNNSRFHSIWCITEKSILFCFVHLESAHHNNLVILFTISFDLSSTF